MSTSRTFRRIPAGSVVPALGPLTTATVSGDTAAATSTAFAPGRSGSPTSSVQRRPGRRFLRRLRRRPARLRPRTALRRPARPLPHGRSATQPDPMGGRPPPRRRAARQGRPRPVVRRPQRQRHGALLESGDADLAGLRPPHAPYASDGPVRPGDRPHLGHQDRQVTAPCRRPGPVCPSRRPRSSRRSAQRSSGTNRTHAPGGRRRRRRRARSVRVGPVRGRTTGSVLAFPKSRDGGGRRSPH